jgi:nickel-dependent lactate racemase
MGVIDAAEVAAFSGGRLELPIPVATSRVLVEGGWDRVVSIGQVVPHEVIGMANFTKNLVIGLGGAPTIHRSHFLGAVCDLETIMGRADTPVRAVVDHAFDRFLAPHVDAVWILTVMQDTAAGVVQRGLFAGRGGPADSGGAAFRAAAALAAGVDITRLAAPAQRVVCWLDPHEFHSTWLGNKAVYRTRLAIADGGELVVLAPGVRTFGEDPLIDALIRRHGYRGTAASLAAVRTDATVADNLGAAAHLIHGSSEGRFTITYCTDPEHGGLMPAELEAVGYAWRPLPAALSELQIDEGTPDGDRHDRNGDPYLFLRNPALGLWTAPDRAGGARR